MVALWGDSFEVIETFNVNDENSNTNNTVIKKEVNVSKPIKQKVAQQPKPKEKKVVKQIKPKIKEAKKSKKAIHSKKAKLVIIIDDISHRYQLNFIKSLPFKVTPSIFPPTKMNMHSYKLARGLKHFMVHLPLESGSRAMNKIYKMIHISDSKKAIEKRIKEVRKFFPTAKYINNHTGSKFSENYAASKRLYETLLQNGFIFVDSRTSHNSKFKKIAKEFHKRYLKCDLYIDNKISVSAIKKELRRAVNLAKRQGYAIVIGHPHIQTFKALKQSAKYIMKNVETLYIDEL